VSTVVIGARAGPRRFSARAAGDPCRARNRTVQTPENELRDRLGDELLDAVIITTGTHAYRRADGIAVIPAALLGP